MHWLLNSPEHQQAWYWPCKTDTMYCSRVNICTWVKRNPRYNAKCEYILCNFKTVQHVKSWQLHGTDMTLLLSQISFSFLFFWDGSCYNNGLIIMISCGFEKWLNQGCYFISWWHIYHIFCIVNVYDRCLKRALILGTVRTNLIFIITGVILSRGALLLWIVWYLLL